MISWFCKHNWGVLVDRTLPSGYEQTEDRLTRMSNAPSELFIKKHIAILTCDKCGKVKKFTEVNFKPVSGY